MIGRILALLAALFLAAHAMRLGNGGAVGFWLLGAVLATVRAPWSGWALGGLLGAGMVLWLEIAIQLVGLRLEQGQPWLRLAIILGAVAGLTGLAALLNGRRAWAAGGGKAWVQGAAFLLTVAGLALAREKSSLDIILADRFFPGSGWLAIFFLGCYAAWIGGKMVVPGQSARWRRRIWAVFSGLFFLQLGLGLLGLEQFLMTGRLHLPVPALILAGPLYRGEGFFMIILFATTLLLVGPGWCSHLCYIGAWDNWSAQQQKRAGQLPAWRSRLRLGICAGVIGGAILLRYSGLSMSVALILAAVFGLVGVVIMLTWSRRSGSMTHCTSYCPMGLLANIFGKINPWRIRMASGCTQCGSCTLVCRYDAQTPLDIMGGKPGLSCTLCGDCISGCPHGQLAYTFPGLQAEHARLAFIVMVVSLHAIFLGVARL
ncbi:4Fe-4S binding protein [Desulfogranum mediterraneum]|uniref:4Fe-4S binding protein n=1 Tax=Desulfogranum mediterraneum TaxID=160661 RepID=UPI0003FBEB24|nr:4Fe-4S binding protein [Desulfogranum mediterraneum]